MFMSKHLGSEAKVTPIHATGLQSFFLSKSLAKTKISLTLPQQSRRQKNKFIHLALGALILIGASNFVSPTFITPAYAQSIISDKCETIDDHLVSMQTVITILQNRSGQYIEQGDMPQYEQNRLVAETLSKFYDVLGTHYAYIRDELVEIQAKNDQNVFHALNKILLDIGSMDIKGAYNIYISLDKIEHLINLLPTVKKIPIFLG